MPENAAISTDALKRIPLFSALGDEALQDLSVHARQAFFPAHHTIFWMNENARYLYVVLSGKVRIFYSNKDGQEITLTMLPSPAYFGEMSMIDNGPHSATARTMEATVLLMVEGNFFKDLLKHNVQLSYPLLEVLCHRLRSNTTTLPTAVNVNEQLEAGRTPLENFVNRLATILTSGLFLTLYTIGIVGWVTAQVIMYKRNHPQPISFQDIPPTFDILDFVITIVSFLLTLLILTNQRRETEEERVRGDIEYQVNVKAQTDITRVQLELAQLSQLVRQLVAQGKEQPPA